MRMFQQRSAGNTWRSCFRTLRILGGCCQWGSGEELGVGLCCEDENSWFRGTLQWQFEHILGAEQMHQNMGFEQIALQWAGLGQALQAQAIARLVTSARVRIYKCCHQLHKPAANPATCSCEPSICDPSICATPMAKGSEFESVQKYLEEVKYERLCVSCWAQVLIDRLLLDEWLGFLIPSESIISFTIVPNQSWMQHQVIQCPVAHGVQRLPMWAVEHCREGRG